MSNKNELGKILKEARIEKGLTVRYAAGLVGISVSYLSNIEFRKIDNP